MKGRCLLLPDLLVAIMLLGGSLAKGDETPGAMPPASSKDPATAGESHGTAEGALALPKMTVRRAAPPGLPDYAWLTDKAKLERALKASPGFVLGNIFGLNNGQALAVQTETRRNKEKGALAEVVENSTIDRQSPEAKRIQKLLEAALQRPNGDWRSAGPGK